MSQFEPLVAANRVEEGRLLVASPLANDLEPILREFFGAMSAESDPQMLIDCFVETRESRYADASLEKIVRTVTASIAELTPSTDNALTREISTAVELGRGETIVIVGNQGAGKSTFMERFFSSVLEPTLRNKCFVVRVDLKRFTGDAASLPSWLASELKKLIENNLFGEHGPDLDELQGLYFSEYQRWSRGQHKVLYETDKDAFKIKFGDFLTSQMSEHSYDYVLRLLDDVVKNRQLLPCMVFDNTDQFSDVKLQEAVFQFSQAIHETIPFTFIVVPVTDTSFWRLSKSGPFQVYPCKTFYLPVPSTKEVLGRRVAYLKRKVEEGKDRRSYFMTRGIQLSVDNIRAFAACVEEVFLNEDFVSRRISWLANNNLRRSLEITHRVITSPYFSIDDLVKAYLVGGQMKLEYRKLMHALVLGNLNQFQQDSNPYVLNAFETSAHYPGSHLLNLSILKALIDRAGEEGGVGSYMPIEQLRNYFDAAGASDAAISHALIVLLNRRLIEPYDASSEGIDPRERVAITHAGRIHYEMATIDPIFLTDMAYATPVRSQDLIDRLRSLRMHKMGAAEWREVQQRFVSYCLEDDPIYLRLPSDSMYDGQRQLRNNLRGRWIEEAIAPGVPRIDPTSSVGDAGKAAGYSRITALVKWFSPEKGYGFVEAGLGEDVFLHASTLHMAEISEVGENDEVICDIAPGSRGRLQVIAVYSRQRGNPSVVNAESKSEFVDGVVDFFNTRKGYGFAKSNVLPEGIYLPLKTVEASGNTSLLSGQLVRMRVEPDRTGRGFMASYLELVN